jgi:DNA-dependent RNA polymerase auxiliary subunit epsilon
MFINASTSGFLGSEEREQVTKKHSSNRTENIFIVINFITTMKSFRLDYQKEKEEHKIITLLMFCCAHKRRETEKQKQSNKARKK